MKQTATTVRDQQPGREKMQDDHDRREAAEVMRLAFPARLKRWGASRYALSRARNGSADSPLFRLRQLLRRGARIGMARESAQLIVADLQAVIEQEWSVAGDLNALLVAEQIADAQEDVSQVRCLVDTDQLADWVRAAKQQVAATLAAIAAAEARIAQQKRWAA